MRRGQNMDHRNVHISRTVYVVIRKVNIPRSLAGVAHRITLFKTESNVSSTKMISNTCHNRVVLADITRSNLTSQCMIPKYVLFSTTIRTSDLLLHQRNAQREFQESSEVRSSEASTSADIGGSGKPITSPFTRSTL